MASKIKIKYILESKNDLLNKKLALKIKSKMEFFPWASHYHTGCLNLCETL